MPNTNPTTVQAMPCGKERALYAASLGYRVFPLVPASRTPYKRETMNQALGLPADAPGGCHHGTTDPADIAAMWAGERANAAIGIATGQGLIALDVDEKGGKSGSATIQAAGWTVPETASQRTLSGGAHYLFDVPAGQPAPTDAGEIGEALDRRGDGGFVVLYDPAVLTAKRTLAPDWLTVPGRTPAGRIDPETARRAPDYATALALLQSRDPDMGRLAWLAFSGAFHAATAGLVDDATALADWQAWNVEHGETNFPAANARQWANFKRGTSGDYSTLIDMAAMCLTKWQALYPGGPADVEAAVRAAVVPAAPPMPAAVAAVRAGRVIDAGNLFAHVLDGDDEPLQFHIEGLVPEDGFVPIYGVPKGGKTFIAIDMAASVATGTDFHGHKVKQGTVFYVAGEGFRSIKRRFRAWSEVRGVPLDDAPLFRSQCAVQLLDAASAAVLTDAVAALAVSHGPPRVIVIDTLARNFGPGDENSTTDMSRFIAALDAIKAAWPGCSVIVVHHSGVMDSKRARGSGALLGAADAEYRVEPGPVLYNTAMKDAAPARAMQFELIEAAGSVALEYVGEPAEGGNRGLSPGATKALDAFKAVAVDGVATREDWRRAFGEACDAEKTDDAKRKAFKRGVEKLIEARLLNEDGDVFRLAPMPGAMPDR